MSDYPYAEGDLLHQRNTYFYSAFEGRAFLEAWRRHREACRAEGAAAGSGPASAVADAPTDVLLDHLQAQLQAGVPAAGLPDLGRLLQRFEVTKRIHAAYGPDWRPLDAGDFELPGRYLRFGEVLELAYRRDGGLPLLNGLLKCLDTLCALRRRLTPPERLRLSALIEREAGHVGDLQARLAGGRP